MGKNNVKAINICSFQIWSWHWKVEDLKSLDRTTLKTLTMYGASYSRSDTDRLYEKQKEGGSGLISIADCVKCEKKHWVVCL